jgi:hypothetical protein
MSCPKIFFLLLFWLFIALNDSSGPYCPNFCNGNGICSNTSIGVCECFPGFIGVDCSQRMCPSGIAWVDFPHGNNSAHAPYAECSNMVSRFQLFSVFVHLIHPLN